jgi:hypothetical protein
LRQAAARALRIERPAVVPADDPAFPHAPRARERGIAVRTQIGDCRGSAAGIAKAAKARSPIRTETGRSARRAEEASTGWKKRVNGSIRFPFRERPPWRSSARRFRSRAGCR